MNADFTARGQSYLSRNLFREVQTQIKAADGDLARAFLAAMSTLDQAFRRIHPFNGPVLEGVRIAAAYLDAASSTVHLASNGGGALCLCGSRQSDGSCSVTASIGTTGPATHNPTECSSQSLHLDSSVDTIMVASPGFWCAPACLLSLHVSSFLYMYSWYSKLVSCSIIISTVIDRLLSKESDHDEQLLSLVPCALQARSLTQRCGRAPPALQEEHSSCQWRQRSSAPYQLCYAQCHTAAQICSRSTHAQPEGGLPPAQPDGGQ